MNADLFLVNSPPPLLLEQRQPPSTRVQRGANRTYLRLSYSTDRVGLSLPYLLDSERKTFDMLEFLEKALKHTWPRECLFVKTETRTGLKSAVRPHPLLYVLADFAWTHNLRLLDTDIKRVSFDNIQSPHMDIATKLHGLREDLAYLRAEVGHMIRFTPPALVRYYNSGSEEDHPYRPREDPVNSSQRIADDAAVLEQFLTDSLNLLIASIALRDSQRADMLTWLAAVYVPLSFVTGIFGMNLRELNDSTLPVWVCLEVLGVVLLVTAAMVVMYKLCVRYSGIVSRKPTRSLESGFY